MENVKLHNVRVDNIGGGLIGEDGRKEIGMDVRDQLELGQVRNLWRTTVNVRLDFMVS